MEICPQNEPHDRLPTLPSPDGPPPGSTPVRMCVWELWGGGEGETVNYII